MIEGESHAEEVLSVSEKQLDQESFWDLVGQFIGALFGVVAQTIGRILLESEVYLVVFSPAKIVSGILLWGLLDEPAFLALSLWGVIDFASVITLLIVRDHEDRSSGRNVDYDRDSS